MVLKLRGRALPRAPGHGYSIRVGRQFVAPSYAFAVVCLLAAGCTPPLSANRVKPAEFYRQQTESVLSSGDPSEITRTVLRRHDLLEHYEQQPEQTLGALRQSAFQGNGGRDEIFALAQIPLAPGVDAHSIIAVKHTTDIKDGDDGVVKYQSAHITGVESELVAHDSHSTQANPHTIAEVRRILLEHVGIALTEQTAETQQ